MMRKRGRQVLVVAAMLCLAAAPVLAHLALATHRGVALAGVLVAAQAAALGWVVGGQAISLLGWRGGAVRLAGWLWACTAGVITFVIWRRGTDGPVAASAIPHLLIYLGLFAVFAASLAPGRTPIITRIAARARGPLNDVLMAYTRRVTIAWCVFFVLQLAISLLLFLVAPLQWWQVFLNLLTLPLVALMFAAELTYRHVRHGIHRPQGQTGTLARLRHMAAQFRAPLRGQQP
jgi:uncharacterized membrane protein